MGKISLITDLWDSKGMRDFSAVTAHYLVCGDSTLSFSKNSHLRLRSSLISFLPLPGQHFGQALAQGLIYTTYHVNITDKVGYLILVVIIAKQPNQFL